MPSFMILAGSTGVRNIEPSLAIQCPLQVVMLNRACTYDPDLYGLKSSAAMPAYSESEIIRIAFNHPSLVDFANIARTGMGGKEIFLKNYVQSLMKSAIRVIADVVIRGGECINPRRNQAPGVLRF